MDGDIREKFFEVYVPRFRGKEGFFFKFIWSNSISFFQIIFQYLKDFLIQMNVIIRYLLK